MESWIKEAENTAGDRPLGITMYEISESLVTFKLTQNHRGQEKQEQEKENWKQGSKKCQENGSIRAI